MRWLHSARTLAKSLCLRPRLVRPFTSPFNAKLGTSIILLKSSRLMPFDGERFNSAFSNACSYFFQMDFEIEHIGLPARDTVRLRDWYVHVFGAELVFGDDS